MIDPLLGRGPAATGTQASTSRRPGRVRGLRVAGAAGMGSLMAITGYMTGAAGSGASATTTEPVAATSATTPATTVMAVPTTAATTTAVSTTAVSTTAPPSTLAACTTTYTVVAGDSWVGIAQRASVVTDILYVLNGSSADTIIHPGDTICLPDGVTVATAPATTAAPSTSSTVAAPVTTTPVIAVPAAPAAQPQSNSSGS